MDTDVPIPDATDWLDGPLRGFEPLETALHCQVCKEFYSTPMITSCSHTFCSNCIRTCLSSDGRCPTCRTADQASKLRNNWALQEVVATFLDARPAALDVARKQVGLESKSAARASRPNKRKRNTLGQEESADVMLDGRTTRSKTRRVAASQSSEPEMVEMDEEDSDGDADYHAEKPSLDDRVDCPLGCGKRMKIEAVEPHLDRCEDEQRQAHRAPFRPPTKDFAATRSSSATFTPPPDRLPELNYSLYNEAKLAKKLRELGIPNIGPKQLMIKRHTAWINMWNANCDSSRPRKKRELLQDLDTWERTQGGKAPAVNGVASTIMRKDFDAVRWVEANKQDFSRLIADAKRKKAIPAGGDEAAKKESEPEPISNSNGLHEHSSARDLADENEFVPDRPYENNEAALSSIREKVEAVNAGQPIEPAMNANFRSSTAESSPAEITDTAAPVESGMSHTALMEQSHFGHQKADVRWGTGFKDMPAHLLSQTKRMPMFAMPHEPMGDVDGGDVAHS